MLRLLPRATPRFGHIKCSRRSFHHDTAILVNLGANGQLVTTRHPITIGEPHEAYVMIPIEVGRVFQAVAASPGFDVRDSEIKRPLYFFHETKHFAHGIRDYALYEEVAANVPCSTESNSSFPRLEIPRDLPRQSSDNKSRATLWLDGQMHEITLNGTPDGSFFPTNASRLTLILVRAISRNDQ